jgi:hypothetical protein
LVITLLGSGGIRLVCQFLELSGLSAFIASSYGVQQRINAALEEAVVEHARMQREQLAEDMPSKTITVCEDETFHPDTTAAERFFGQRPSSLFDAFLARMLHKMANEHRTDSIRVIAR